MLKQTDRHHEAMPKEIALLVENVCNMKINNTQARPPHMLIPMNSGDGRSRLVRLISDRYFCAKACAFSSRDLYLDFTLRDSVQRIYEVDAYIQSNAEYANQFQGLISFDIDNLVSCLSEAAGIKFFELVQKIKNHSVVVIFVPSDCTKRHLDTVREKVGLNMHLFTPINYSDLDYAKFFCDFLPSGMWPKSPFSPGHNYIRPEKNIVEYIANNILCKSIKNIKEAAESLIFNDEAREKIFGSTVCTIKERKVAKR